MRAERGDGALRICLVTSEFADKDPVSSAALHFSALAALLARAGHDVHVLYTGYCDVDEGHRCVRRCEAAGICFVPLVDPDFHEDERVTSRVVHRVYQWLNIRHFHVVHYLDEGAAGFYALLAREQGLDFADTVFTLLPLRCSRRRKQLGEFYLDSPRRLKTEHLEASVRGKVDYVLDCGSGFDSQEAPAMEVLLALLIPQTVAATDTQSQNGHEDTIVFLHDMDVPGGIEAMIDACLELSAGTSSRFIFLGRNRFLPTYDMDAATLLGKILPAASVDLELDAGLNDVALILSRLGVRVVVPGLHDTACWATRVCLDLGVPFIGYATPGNRALVHKAHHHRLHDPAESLATLLRDGGHPEEALSPARSPEETEQAWLDWHEGMVPRRPAAPVSVSGKPLVSVCIATYERPDLLARALGSLLDQDYPRLELIVVDDGGPSDEAERCVEALDLCEGRTVRFLKIENSGPAAARNHGARHAGGDYLMFMDDDNYALSHEVSTFVSVAQRTGADILTCTHYCSEHLDIERFDPWRARMILPVGNYPDLALLECCMGDTNMFLRPESFLDLGGFPEGDRDEDWDFLLNASLAGCRIEVVPEPLFIYHWHLDSNARAGSRHGREMRRVGLFKKHAGRFPSLLELVHGTIRGRGIAGEHGQVLIPLRAKAANGDVLEALEFREGFYDDEAHFRWARRTAEIRVLAELPRLAVGIGNNALDRFGATQTIRVFRNGEPEAALTLGGTEPAQFALENLEKGDQITFSSDFDFCPADWGSHDQRKLSFMFFYPDQSRSR
jgi:GT2 family glycosyltransferase